MIRALLAIPLFLSLNTPSYAQDDAYYNDIAFDPATSDGFVAATFNKVPAPVRGSARGVKRFVGQIEISSDPLKFHGVLGTAFFFQDNTTLMTARSNFTLHGTPTEFLKKFAASGEKLRTDADHMALDKQVLTRIKKDYLSIFLHEPNDTLPIRTEWVFHSTEKDDLLFDFYLDPDALSLYRRFTKADGEAGGGIAAYTSTDYLQFHLKQKPKRLPTPLKLATKKPAIGSAIYVIGVPLVNSKLVKPNERERGITAGKLYISWGKVLAVKDGVIWHNASVGDSSPGSAIVDAEGKLVGIHTLESVLPSGKVIRGGPAASSLVEHRTQFPEFVKDLEKRVK